MTSPSSTAAAMDISSTPPTASDPQPRCQTCKNDLTTIDKTKKSNRYYKNCQKCRDKRATANRNRVELRSAATARAVDLSGAHSNTRKRTSEQFQRFPREAKPSQTLRWPNKSTSYGGVPPLRPNPATALPKSHTSDLDDSDSEPLIKRARRENEHADPKAADSVDLWALWDEFDAGSESTSSPREKPPEKRKQPEEAEKTKINTAKAPDQASQPKVLEPPNERVCSICVDSFPVQNFPGLADCDHDADVCHDDFLRWMNQRMANMEKVTCPSSGCSVEVTHADVQKYASKEDFIRFDELSMRSFLSAHKTFLYCLAKGCPSGQIHDTGVEGPIFRCAACGYRMCTAHDPIIPFHENEVCTQYNERIAREEADIKDREEEEEKRVRTQQEEDARIRREQEEASAAEVGRSSVECPGCGSQIQKIDGCDHMTCCRKGCGFQFCYVCRTPYNGEQGIRSIGNSAHAESCLYHSERLPYL